MPAEAVVVCGVASLLALVLIAVLGDDRPRGSRLVTIMCIDVWLGTSLGLRQWTVTGICVLALGVIAALDWTSQPSSGT